MGTKEQIPTILVTGLLGIKLGCLLAGSLDFNALGLYGPGNICG